MCSSFNATGNAPNCEPFQTQEAVSWTPKVLDPNAYSSWLEREPLAVHVTPWSECEPLVMHVAPGQYVNPWSHMWPLASA